MAPAYHSAEWLQVGAPTVNVGGVARAAHAAPIALAYQAQIRTDERELRQRLQEPKGFPGALLKLGAAAHFDAVDEIALTAAGKKYLREFQITDSRAHGDLEF